MNQRKNFIAIDRDSFKHPLFAGEKFSRREAWFWMIAQACWRSTKFNDNGSMIELNRGEFATTIRELSETFSWSKGAVERFIARLKTETMIGTRIGTKKTIITICNYDDYQNANDKSGTINGTENGTKSGQSRDIKEELNNKTSLKRLSDDNPKKGDALSRFGDDQIKQAFDDWNALAKHRGLPIAAKLTQQRKSKLKARLKDAKDFGSDPNDGFRNVLRRASQSSFLMGERSDYRLTLDSLLGQKLFIKAMEGGFDNNTNQQSSNPWLRAAQQMEGNLNDGQATGTEFDEADFTLDGSLLIDITQD